MGLFTKFKMLFNKSITLLPHQRNDVVSFVKLKKNMIKIGTELLVGDDYNLVSVYFNKVCDVLGPGEYKADEVSLPKLFRHSKAYFSKKGLFTPKMVTTDLYYVCTRAFTHYVFMTNDRIIAHHKEKKVKLKLEGTFTMKITNAEKLMEALCNDYAVIRNKQAVKDITSTIASKISKVLNSKQFSLTDYLSSKEKIAEILNEEINLYIEKYGLSAKDFFINNVILPKKVAAQSLLDKQQVVSENNIDIVKIVEERLNNIEKDLNMAYVESANGSTVKQAKESSDDVGLNKDLNLEKDIKDDIFIIDDNTQIKTKKSTTQSFNESIDAASSTQSWQGTNQNDFTTFSFSSQSQPEPIIIEEIKPAEPPAPISEAELSDDFIDGVIEKIEKRKKQKKRDRLAEILNQADITFGQEKSSAILNIKPTKKCSSCKAELQADAKFCSKCGASTEGLKTCPCCGAKNFPTASACCVCKSLLD